MAKKKNKPNPNTSAGKLSQVTSGEQGKVVKTSLDPADRSVKWIFIGLAVISFLLYANTLGHQYVLDDGLSMQENELVKKGIRSIPELLANQYRAGTETAKASALLYRPLSLITFAIEWSIAPGKPFIGHFFNVLWFTATVVLLYAGLRRLFHQYHWFWALGTTLLFAVHPIHTEVVANIKSRDEILNAFFSIAALYCCVRWLSNEGVKWLWMGLVAYFMALLSKESAVSFLPVLPLVAWFFYHKNSGQSIRTFLVFAAPVILFLLMRQAVLNKEDGEYTVNEFDNAIVGAQSFAEKTMTSFMLFWKYVQLLIWPQPLISDYSYNYLQLAQPGQWQPIAGLILFIVLIVYSLYGLIKRKPLAFCTIAFLSSVILYLQLLMVIGTMFGERLMYMPSVWFCAGIVYLLMQLFQMMKVNTRKFSFSKQMLKLAIPFTVLVVVYVVLTFNRNKDWKDNLTLFTADVAKAPNSIRLLNGQCSEWYRQIYNDKKMPLATKENLLKQIEMNTQKALAIKDNPISFYNLGNVAYARQQYDSSLKYYEKTMELAPGFRPARSNAQKIAVTWARREGRINKNLPRAIELFEKAIGYGVDEADVYLDLGAAYGMSGQPGKAIIQFEKAAVLAPQNKSIWKNLAMAYRLMGNIEKAKECEAKAGLISEPNVIKH